MAIKKDQFKADVQSIEPSPEGVNHTRLQQLIEFRMIETLKSLGLSLDDGDDFYKGADGMPLLYELGEDGSYKSALENKDDYKTKEFAEKLAAGKLVAFPPGEKNPVQLQVSLGQIKFSKPLTEAPKWNRELPKEPAQMGWLKRFAHWVTGGRAYRAEFETYETETRKYQEAREKESRLSNGRETKFRELLDARTPERLASEKADFAKRWEEQAKKEKQAELAEKREKIKKEYENVISEKPLYSVDIYRNTYGLTYGANTKNEDFLVKSNFCTSEQYKELKDYSGVIQDTKFSEEEFTALSILSAFSLEIGGKYVAPIPGDCDMGPELNIAKGAMYIGETMVGRHTAPRDSHGHILKPVVEPARKRCAEAIEDYKQGKYEKLGGLIAEGIMSMTHLDEAKPLSQERNIALTSMMGVGLDLLDSDKELRKVALVAKKPDGTPFITEDDLDLVKGYKKALELTRANEKARTILKAWSAGVCELSDEDRKKYIDDCCAFDQVDRSSKCAIEEIKKGKEYKKSHDALTTEVEQGTLKQSETKNAYDKLMKEKTKQILDMNMAKTEEDAQKIASLDKNVKLAEQNYELASKKNVEALAKLGNFDALHIHCLDTYMALGKAKQSPVEVLDQTMPDRKALYELKGEDLLRALEPKQLGAYYPKEPVKTEPAVNIDENIKNKDVGQQEKQQQPKLEGVAI